MNTLQLGGKKTLPVSETTAKITQVMVMFAEAMALFTEAYDDDKLDTIGASDFTKVSGHYTDLMDEIGRVLGQRVAYTAAAIDDFKGL